MISHDKKIRLWLNLFFRVKVNSFLLGGDHSTKWNYFRKNGGVMLASQAGLLLSDMMSHNLISLKLGFFVFLSLTLLKNVR